MANSLGKRYECETCGTIVLCAKATPAAGTVHCCSKEMKIQTPKQLPSSD